MNNSDFIQFTLQLADMVGIDIVGIRAQIGNMLGLNTNHKTTLVGAINEVNGKVGLLNGLQFESDPATATLKIKDGNGNLLTSISLAYLNNEGTRLSFNLANETIELINDEDQVLSAMPVSAFLTNLVSNANFNGTTPNRLDFKDNAGSILFSIDYKIANIQGLQDALNNINTTIGNRTNLSTVYKTDLVGAINEVNNKSKFTQYKELRTYYLHTGDFSTARKLRLYLNEGFAGTIKIEVTGSWNAQNASGEIIVQGGLGVNAGVNGWLWSSAVNCTGSTGSIRNHIYIKPYFEFDNAIGHPFIEINKMDPAGNGFGVKVTLFSHLADLTNMEPYIVDMGTGNVDNGVNEVVFQGKISAAGGNSDVWNEVTNDALRKDFGHPWVSGFQAWERGFTWMNGSQTGLGQIAAWTGCLIAFGHSDHKSQILVSKNRLMFRTNFGAHDDDTFKEVYTDQNFNPNNYIPTSHPAYNITQANILNWLQYLGYVDNRNIRPEDIGVNKLQFGFTNWFNNHNQSSHYADYLHFGGYHDASGGLQNLIMFSKMGFGLRQFQGTHKSPTPYQSFVDYWHTGTLTEADVNKIKNFVAGDFVSKLSVNESVAGVKRFVGFYTEWTLNDDSTTNAQGFAQSIGSGFLMGTLNDKDYILYRNSQQKVFVRDSRVDFVNSVHAPVLEAINGGVYIYGQGGVNANTTKIFFNNPNASIGWAISQGINNVTQETLSFGTWDGSTYVNKVFFDNTGNIYTTQFGSASDWMAKVTNMENATGIGFSNGSFSGLPYFYHPTGGYKFLATIEYINNQDYASVTYVNNAINNAVANISVHNGQLTVNTTADLVGGYVYLPSGNVTTTLGLATHILNAIADGQAAYNFGNHATQGYLKIADLAPYETTVSVNNKLTAKQDKLIAGTNVFIVGNTISAIDTDTVTRIGVWGGNYSSGDINFTATGSATIVKNGNNINIDVSTSGGIPNQGVEVLDFTPGSYSIDTHLSTTIVRCTAGGSMYSFDVKKGKYDGDELCFTSCGYEYQAHGEILSACSTGLIGGSSSTRFIWSDQLAIWVQVA